MTTKKILIIEDDDTFSEILNEYLLLKGFEVATATDGLSGVIMHQSFLPDLILLDVALPEMNGIEVAKNIRIKDKITPIIFMSGTENANEDQIRSFMSGGNDHLEKGFHLDVLHCKIVDRLNSQIIPENNIFQFKLGKEILTLNENYLEYKKHKIKLIDRERKILRILLSTPNQAVSRKELTKSVWNHWSDNNDHMLSNYIRSIKDKLKPLEKVLEIKPVYGNGYILRISI